jgi:hypothetical protein
VMRWLPTDDWSGRLLIFGGVFALVGVVVALSNEVAPPHAFFRAIAVVCLIVAAGAGVTGLAISGAGHEAARRRRGMKTVPFYRKRLAYLWRSMPGPARVAFGLVVPTAVAVITLLIVTGSPRRLVEDVWVLSLALFLVLLTVAGRAQTR